MIMQTVNFSMFHDAFKALSPDNFNYDGLQAMFNYLEDISEDIGEPIELDVIGLCCDWRQMTLDEIKEQYNIPDHADVLDWLNDMTIVIRVAEDSYLFRVF